MSVEAGLCITDQQCAAATQICNAEGTCHVLIIDYSINILAVLGGKWKPTDKYFSESMQTKFASYMQSIH